jgi:diguanylate cyclase (GGDEF)-like protein
MSDSKGRRTKSLADGPLHYRWLGGSEISTSAYGQRVEDEVDLEQAAFDAGRAASESDRESSERDRIYSEADQRASDRERTIADRESSNISISDLDVESGREISRAERAETRAARARNATIRAETRIRRSAAADSHTEAQKQASASREAQRIALAEAQFDDLTGAYRRNKGNAELHGEVDRANRSGGRLVLAFVDVDGLKAHNDREGHAAGDELLLNVVASIRSSLRSYDPVMRFGGDEFICALSGVDLNDARNRFAEIQIALKQAHPGGSISVGLAQLRAGETLEKLMARGDDALREAKRRK